MDKKFFMDLSQDKNDSFTHSEMGKQAFWYDFIVSSQYRWHRRIALLLLFGLLFLTSKEKEYIGNMDIYLNMAFVLYLLLLIYLNVYILIPKLLAKSKIFLYILSLIFLAVFTFIIIMIFDQIFYEYKVVKNGKPAFSLVSLLHFTLSLNIILASTTAIKLFQNWLRTRENFYKMREINFQNELALLKNQISPHFLFNTLNNANILIEDNPKLASSLIVNLSELLRYQIYDCSEESIILRSDIQFFENFLSIESSRRDDFEYEILVTGEKPDILVPPLLFIPFIENAVKHNNNYEKAFVKVHFHLENTILHFTCMNSKAPIESTTLKGGIGLTNIRKRLELLYPDKYQLIIENKPSSFFVDLIVEL
ncbi:sensor histidine kinase [Chryseobacterium paridis]|uniref:Histidine kinase n=1 Tax=Chryseobacterium paridis TaxID=2800328 RepID=A0ABS1FY60_9FLAO|nr:histidine kinase [Chryseobacterium paridis]MBK1897268.1 histidine kinase [Chryseobacterium paridis]